MTVTNQILFFSPGIPPAAASKLVIPFFSRSCVSVSLHPPLSSFLPPSCCVCPLPPHTIHPRHCPGRSPGQFFGAGCILFLLPLAFSAPQSHSPLLSSCAICLLPHLLLPLSHCPQTPFFTKETAAAAAMEKKLYACCVYLTCVMCVSQAVCKITCAIRPLRSSRLLPSQLSPPMRLQLQLRLRLRARSLRPEPRFLRRLSESDRLLPPFPRAPPAGTTIHPALLSPFACVRDRGDGSGGGGDSSSSGCNGS